METTAQFYQKQAYTWQSNIDDLFRFALSVLFTRAKEKLNSTSQD